MSNEQYEYKTYPMGSVYLNEGWYSRAELMELLKEMDMLSKRAKATLDAAELASKPGVLKDRGKT